MRWVGHVACIGKNRNLFRILEGRLDQGRSHMDLKHTIWDGMNWTEQAQYIEK